ncbi:MAG: hypothetical protein Q7S51_00820 [Gallionellaceae bacterium]|nr:hypothetical protein [Gallionellaceae bacterium]
MSTVTFDTLKFVKTLEASGINEKQAEATRKLIVTRPPIKS